MPSNVTYARHILDLWRNSSDKIVMAAIHIVAILVAYLVLRAALYRVIDGVLGHLIAVDRGGDNGHRGRLRTLQGICRSVVGYAFFFLFGVLILETVGFNIVPFITTAGVIGLAIGFGSQKLVKDVIAGFFIIIDQMFVVGDTVTVGALTGQVMEMGMRVTRLHDANGKVHLLSNGDIGTVTNHSRFPVEDFVEVQIAASANLTAAMLAINTALADVFESEPETLRAAPRVLGIPAFTGSAVTIRIAVVADPRSLVAEQMRVRAAIRTALLTAEIALAP